MTITIDIPAVQALANAINNLANRLPDEIRIPRNPTQEELAEEIRINQLRHDERQAAMEASTTATTEPTPPAKRTRRTKAEMEAERKAIEEQKGRRVDLKEGSTSEQTEFIPDQTNPDDPEPVSFQWTLEQLVDTFIAPIQPADKTEEAKEKANALRCELVAIRQEVDPKAQKMIEVDPQHYPELAKRFTAWFKDKGLELQLPEGAE